jgi:predicted small secreted protein
MKKLAVIIAVAFALALALSSCNNELCPAYSDAGTDIEHVG